MLIKSCILALKDYGHERLLSACAVLSLAAVLTPLLVLYGVKYGIITTMTDRLQNNPHNLEIIPVSSGHYTKAWIADLAKNPHVGFILPKTRSIASTMSIGLMGESNILKRITVSLEPTAEGDTLLAPYMPPLEKQDTQPKASQADKTTEVREKVQAQVQTQVQKQYTAPTCPENSFSVSLSAEAARKLGAKPHSLLQGYVERLYNGKVERASVHLWVRAVLPLAVQQKDVAFVPLTLLEATEDFRDGRWTLQDARLPENQGWTGDMKDSAQAQKAERIYPAFRLYAKNLDAVTALREYFASKSIDVYTKAEEIATVRALNASLNLIFGLIGSTAALGFVASTASHAQAAVRRKERYLGILRLVGYNGFDIMIFPLFQSFLTALLGSALAAMLYGMAAAFIEYLFAHSLQGATEQICSLPPEHFAMGFAIVVILSLLATLLAAIKAAKIIPSEVIRDI